LERPEITNYFSMAEESRQLMELAESKGIFRKAVVNSYYWAFSVASALVLLDGKDTSSHKGVISYINQYYVNTGLMSRNLGGCFKSLEEKRNEAEYDPLAVISEDTVKECKSIANQLVIELTGIINDKSK
jgi:uncharacterized protein (UPF0332 family)